MAGSNKKAHGQTMRFFFSPRGGSGGIPLLLDFELVFAYAAERANPLVGQGFKRRAGRNPRIGVAGGGVVHVAAYDANILFHKRKVYSCLR